jgi:predicted transglutaminase-like cysteine proteinase
VLVVTLASFRWWISYILGAVIAVASSGVVTPAAHAAGIPTLSANLSLDYRETAQTAAFVPVGPAAPVPVAFDPSVRNGGGYDWTPLFASETTTDDQTTSGRAIAVPLTQALRATLEEINRVENGRRFGPDHRHLDCVGYVLAKRDALLRAGLPADVLSPAVVRTHGGVVHAVLIVTTADGDQVLDNLSPYVEPWRRVDYEWIKRQVSTGNGVHWAWVGRAAPTSIKIASGR